MAVPSGYNTHKDYFHDALNFLKSYRWLYNFPNTHILVNKVFQQFPDEWMTFLQNLSTEELNSLALGDLSTFKENPPPSLEQFINETNRLKPAIKSRDPVDFEFSKNFCKKKAHEIVSLAPLIHEICIENGCDFVVDIGTGLGYLPQLLYDKYKYRALGIEGNPDKVRLAKINQTKYPESSDSIKYVEHFITKDSLEVIKEMVDFSVKSACLTGLHACADLSVAILELFTKLDFAKALVIMPCCYHRLKQNGDGFENFPASQLLKGVSRDIGAGDFLKIPFLRLACQSSVENFSKMSQKEHEEHANNCLLRAILQDVAESGSCQVRRLKRKSGTVKESSEPFESYLRKLKYTHTLIGGDINDEEFLKKMREKWMLHKGNCSIIEALIALQTSIQGICENVILLDRVVFLMEKGVKCFVVKVTDQKVSPRCYALIAVKM